jgi:hypothetical protein
MGAPVAKGALIVAGVYCEINVEIKFPGGIQKRINTLKFFSEPGAKIEGGRRKLNGLKTIRSKAGDGS